jgi:branched-chain amino acid aminotransferase
MEQYFNYNGKFYKSGEKIITPDSRAFRYGDGLFETMVFSNNSIRLVRFHLERLYQGLATLKYELPKLLTPEYVKTQVFLLCKKNNLQEARVRLAFFRGEGGVFDPEDLHPRFVIQCSSLPAQTKALNENGLVIDVYPDARKSMDRLANIKSANYLPYLMAALYARENKLNDCLLLNGHAHIADSTIANIFCLLDGQWVTPPLSEGCVAGVMRRFLLENTSTLALPLVEKQVTLQDLEAAEEVFLTNAVYGIRWVQQYRNRRYGNVKTKQLYHRLLNLLTIQQ